MFILISAPVYKRDWILPDWFAAIENQDFPLHKIGFQFEAAPDDEETIAELLKFHEQHPEVRCFDISINDKEVHSTHPEGSRLWKKDRYPVMANFRNNLLRRAICKEPDRFFSLDTDILLENPATISTLVQLTAALDAVSPLAFMTPHDIKFPNVMNWGLNGIGYRNPDGYPFGATFQADIIMAAVMMSKKVYQNVRYQAHPQGEDLGWSLAMKEHGYQMYCISHLYVPHIMSRTMLINYKKSGDARKRFLKEAGY